MLPHVLCSLYLDLISYTQAEVLSKRVVVQHLPLGGLVRWDPPPSSSPAAQSPWSGAVAPVTTLAPKQAAVTGRSVNVGGAATNILPPLRSRKIVSSGGPDAQLLPPLTGAVPVGTTAAPWARTKVLPVTTGQSTAAPWASARSSSAAGATAAPWATSLTPENTNIANSSSAPQGDNNAR